MNTLKFTSNWNNKLACPAFGTVRLDNEEKYGLGRRFQVWLNGRELGRARVVSYKRFHFDTLNDALAYLDTGHDAAYLRAVLGKMYPLTAWDRQLLCHVVLVWETPVPVVAPKRHLIEENQLFTA